MKSKPTFKLDTYRNIRRFMRKIEQREDGCWIWLGGCDHRRNPLFYIGGNHKCSARRVAYAYRFGEVPRGMVLVTTCGNEKCVQPYHLMPVQGGANSGRTKKRCKRGHWYTPETTVITSQGKKTCRLCIRETIKIRQRRYALEGKPYRPRSRKWYVEHGVDPEILTRSAPSS